MPIVIFNHRRDLRINDNLTLFKVLSQGNIVIPVFFFDPKRSPILNSLICPCLMDSLISARKSISSLFVIHLYIRKHNRRENLCFEQPDLCRLKSSLDKKSISLTS